MNKEDYPNSESYIRALKESNADLLEDATYWKGMVEYVKEDDTRIRQERADALKEAIEAKHRAKKLEDEKKILLHFLTLKHSPEADILIQSALSHLLAGNEITWDLVMKEVSKVYLRQILRQGEELNLD